MVSVTSRLESGRTLSSAWKSRMRRVRAEAGTPSSAASTKPKQRRTPQETRRGGRFCRGIARHRIRAERMERGSGRRRRAEADVRDFAFDRGRDFKEFAGFEIAHAGNHVRRELLDARIEVAHGGVVIAARVLQRVFDLAKRGLKLGKVVSGAKLRVGFREREELAQSAG